MPASVNLIDADDSSLNELLEGIAGFAIVEKATMKKTPELRSAIDVDELWDSMCQSAIMLISKALHEVTNAEVLLKIKGAYRALHPDHGCKWIDGPCIDSQYEANRP